MRSLVLLPLAAVAGISGMAGTAAAVAGHARRPAVRSAPRRDVVTAPRRSFLLPITLGPPTVTTGAVTGLTSTSATLTGSVGPTGWSLGYLFQYGPTTAYGQWAPSAVQAVTSSRTATTAISQSITGLQPATTYHYRLAVEGTFDYLLQAFAGADETFTTPASTVTPLPTAPTTTGAGTTAPVTGTTAPSTGTAGTATTTTTTGTAPAGTTPSTGTSPVSAVAAPVVGQAETIAAASGTVTVTEPGSSIPVALSAASSIPLGAVVNATHGVAEVTNALADGRTQKVSVWAGRFTMTQNRYGRTWLHLVGAPACPAGRLAHAAGTRSVTLWAHDHHGRYGTRGDNSVATVRGTEWGTTESCAGTRTTVRIGRVDVRDLHTGRSVIVSAGHSVLVPS